MRVIARPPMIKATCCSPRWEKQKFDVVQEDLTVCMPRLLRKDWQDSLTSSSRMVGQLLSFDLCILHCVGNTYLDDAVLCERTVEITFQMRSSLQ